MSRLRVVLGAAAIVGVWLAPASSEPPAASPPAPETVKLPEPRREGPSSVEAALAERRSVRTYSGQPISLGELGQLLWAAQGITSGRGQRTAPSAGALYPLEVYVVAGNVTDLGDGVYRYVPQGHELVRVSPGDRRADLSAAAVEQACVRDGAAVIVFAADYARTTRKYGERGIRYVHIEIGHAAQNVFLQAVALGLGTVTVGSFSDEAVGRIVGLPAEQRALYLMPVGRK